MACRDFHSWSWGPPSCTKVHGARGRKAEPGETGVLFEDHKFSDCGSRSKAGLALQNVTQLLEGHVLNSKTVTDDAHMVDVLGRFVHFIVVEPIFRAQ